MIIARSVSLRPGDLKAMERDRFAEGVEMLNSSIEITVTGLQQSGIEDEISGELFRGAHAFVRVTVP